MVDSNHSLYPFSKALVNGDDLAVNVRSLMLGGLFPFHQARRSLLYAAFGQQIRQASKVAVARLTKSGGGALGLSMIIVSPVIRRTAQKF